MIAATQQKGEHVNTDPSKSTQPCGCDEGANYFRGDCHIHGKKAAGAPEYPASAVVPTNPVIYSPFTDDAKTRKGYPMYSGLLKYFPLALAEVAFVSKIGNDQHNPGQPLHWAREKSTDQLDTAIRHITDHAAGFTLDKDHTYHLAKAIWRLCAELELLKEKERAV